MKPVPQPIPRQQLPEDSVSSEVSEIHQPSPIHRNGSIFGTNDRNPEMENFSEIESLMKWINNSVPTEGGSSASMKQQRQPEIIEKHAKWKKR